MIAPEKTQDFIPHFDLERAMYWLKRGCKVRRVAWKHFEYAYVTQNAILGCTKHGEFMLAFGQEDILATDYVLVP